jgi:hypothetical protein
MTRNGRILGNENLLSLAAFAVWDIGYYAGFCATIRRIIGQVAFPSTLLSKSGERRLQ